MANTIKIVGLDPSLSNFGIAQCTLDIDTLEFSVDNLILVETSPEKDKKVRKQVRKNSEDLDRAQALYGGMLLGCTGAKLAIAEVPVGSQSSRAMASYGVCLGVLAACPIPLVQVTPNEVKIAATNCKTATKEEMIEWANEKYPYANWLTHKRGGQTVLTAKNEHLADAIAAVEAGIRTDQFQQILAMMRNFIAH